MCFEQINLVDLSWLLKPLQKYIRCEKSVRKKRAEYIEDWLEHCSKNRVRRLGIVTNVTHFFLPYSNPRFNLSRFNSGFNPFLGGLKK